MCQRALIGNLTVRVAGKPGELGESSDFEEKALIWLVGGMVGGMEVLWWVLCGCDTCVRKKQDVKMLNKCTFY